MPRRLLAPGGIAGGEISYALIGESARRGARIRKPDPRISGLPDLRPEPSFCPQLARLFHRLGLAHGWRDGGRRRGRGRLDARPGQKLIAALLAVAERDHFAAQLADE